VLHRRKQATCTSSMTHSCMRRRAASRPDARGRADGGHNPTAARAAHHSWQLIDGGRRQRQLLLLKALGVGLGCCCDCCISSRRGLADYPRRHCATCSLLSPLLLWGQPRAAMRDEAADTMQIRL
jgi:hypothetical protein